MPVLPCIEEEVTCYISYSYIVSDSFCPCVIYDLSLTKFGLAAVHDSLTSL